LICPADRAASKELFSQVWFDSLCRSDERSFLRAVQYAIDRKRVKNALEPAKNEPEKRPDPSLNMKPS
jgi:hypothetical protein